MKAQPSSFIPCKINEKIQKNSLKPAKTTVVAGTTGKKFPAILRIFSSGQRGQAIKNSAKLIFPVEKLTKINQKKTLERRGQNKLPSPSHRTGRRHKKFFPDISSIFPARDRRGKSQQAVKFTVRNKKLHTRQIRYRAQKTISSQPKRNLQIPNATHSTTAHGH